MLAQSFLKPSIVKPLVFLRLTVSYEPEIIPFVQNASIFPKKTWFEHEPSMPCSAMMRGMMVVENFSFWIRAETFVSCKSIMAHAFLRADRQRTSAPVRSVFIQRLTHRCAAHPRRRSGDLHRRKPLPTIPMYSSVASLTTYLALSLTLVVSNPTGKDRWAGTGAFKHGHCCIEWHIHYSLCQMLEYTAKTFVVLELASRASHNTARDQ